MCGRYTLTSPHDSVAEYFETGTAPEFAARYNLAPTQEALVVTLGDDGGRSARTAKWGFTIPRGESSRLVINARSEDVEHRPAFRESFATRRCLVPANGFFEWTKIGRTKQPYYFTLREHFLVGLAGLWSEDAFGGLTYVILTTQANEVVGRVHSRMPVIVRQTSHAAWLQRESLSETAAREIFQPWPAQDTISEAVGMRVNVVSCDEPDCIKPLAGPVDLFTN